MYKVTIQPQWQLHTEDGQRLPPRLVELLLAIRATGSLAAACRQTGLSYRYAWGTLREARRLFGQPLLRTTGGRGARLAPIGERLVRAEQRIAAARLAPTLESLASELETELERVFRQEAAPLRLHASHGFEVETLRRFMVLAGTPLELKYRSPDDALAALRNNDPHRCAVAVRPAPGHARRCRPAVGRGRQYSRRGTRAPWLSVRHARASRPKLLVHDGLGVWCATRRLHTGRFVWCVREPHSGAVALQLGAQQFEVLALGLPWQRLGELSTIRSCDWGPIS